MRIFVIASRGRPRPADGRGVGVRLHRQNAEVNATGKTNSLTTVQKDSMLLECYD